MSTTTSTGPVTATIDLLVVEDSPTNVAVIRRLLGEHVAQTGARIQVRTAGDLAEAVAQVLDEPPDAVLLDLTLPDSSGLATFDHLRALADLPVVVLTGTEDHELAIEAVRRGAQDYVVKGQLTAPVLGSLVGHAIERHRLTVRLRDALQEAEVAGERVRALVSMASHELLSPMSTVQGFATLLDERWDELEEEQRRTQVATIARTSRHLARLARQFLDIAAHDGTDIPVRTTTFDLVDLAREVVEGSSNAADVQLTSPVRAHVRADRDHVASILSNLLTNAAKYGRPPVELQVRASAGDVLLVVRDNGPGIPADVVPTLFEAYTRGDTTAAERDGHGLGMHIVRRLVTSNDGAVRYCGDGTGAAFEVRLPRP